MRLQAQGTNVIILYGDGAIARFSDIVNRWSTMLMPADQWNGLQFILVGSDMPKLTLEPNAAPLVNSRNARFYRFGDQPLGSQEFHNLIFDKVRTGSVILHAVCDSGNKEISYDWLRKLIRGAMEVESLTTQVMYYLMIGLNALPSEQRELLELIGTQEGAVFFLGDMNDSGAMVEEEDRWHAAGLVVLMNCTGTLPVRAGTSAYSLGYTALNANGAELKRLDESAACDALIAELNNQVTSNAQIVNQLDLMPEGASSLQELRGWLQEYISRNTPQINPTVLKNAWITIRMDAELSSGEAIRRMKRFVDLNYAGEQSVGNLARELAWRTESAVRERMRGNVLTASLAPGVLREIAEAFRRLKSEDIEPGGCTYPKKPLKMIFGKGMEEYVAQCKTAVMKPIRDYISARNLGVFAGELERAYLRLEEWAAKARGEGDYTYRRLTAQELLQDIRKEMETGDNRSTTMLSRKYKNYFRELSQLHPTLAVLTEDVKGTYFSSDGEIVESEWRSLVRRAGKNMEKKLSAGFRGDFFRVLNNEFSTPDERVQFFDNYLQNGPRMYRNLQAQQSSGNTVYLVDDHLMDKWFVGDKYEVKTDNAENLTLYPLGDQPASFYLQDTTAYFKGTGKQPAPGGVPLDSQGPEYDLFGSGNMGGQPLRTAAEEPGEGEEPEKEKERPGARVRLDPDGKGNYWLYWKWKGNDPTAVVEITQYGERVGKVAVIPVALFKQNGDRMNVTDDVMNGRPIPNGTLTVKIKDSRREVYIDSTDVPGRRELLNYKVSGSMLQLKPENRRMVEKLLLRTTDADGVHTYYPLYPAEDDKPWLYTGLALSNGRIIEDPAGDQGTICIINVMD